MLRPRLILLDRDGVINTDLPKGVSSLSQWNPIPGSLETIVGLKKKGFCVAVVTNQGMVGRGELSVEGLEALHAHLQNKLIAMGGGVDHFFVSMDAQSPRHTPSGAMIVEALQMFQTSAPHTLMVGDHHHDEVLINRLAAHPSRTAQPHPRSASCWGRCLGRP